MSSDNTSVRIPQFNGKNFGLWKKQVLVALKVKGIGNSIVEVAEEIKQDATWQKQDNEAQALLFSSLEQTVALKVVSCATAAEIWSRLKEIYENTNVASVGKVFEEYYSYRKSPGDDMATHVSKVEALASHLETLGQKQTDVSIMSRLIHSLPASYNALREAWESVAAEKQSKTLLVSRLLSHGNMGEEPEKDTALVAESQQQSGSSQRSNKRRNGKCYNCGKFGHFAQECRSKPRNKEDGVVLVASAQKNKSNSWVVDSGASQHTCCRKEWFTTMEHCQEKLQVGNQALVESVGRGTVVLECIVSNRIEKIYLSNVLYIPSMSYNLFSTGQASDKGASVVLDDRGCRVIVNGELKAIGCRGSNGLCYLNANVRVGKALIISQKRTSEDWHRALGHVDQQVITEMANNESLRGFQVGTPANKEGYKDVPNAVLKRNFVSRSIRKLIMENIIPALLGKDLERGSVVIETELEAIYSSKLFNSNSRFEGLTVDSSGKVFSFNNLFVKTDLLANLRVDLVITYFKSFALNSSQQVPIFLASILHHQLFLDKLRYGSVYYTAHESTRGGSFQDRRLDLISEHIMGISLSGLRRGTDDKNIVVINCPHSYITKHHHLLDLLASFIHNEPTQCIRTSHTGSISQFTIRFMPEIKCIVGTEDWFLTFCSSLKGFKCRPTGVDENVNLRFNLTDESATKILMTDTITVEEHYKQLGINLVYPNLPCLKSQTTRTYYPLELCFLLPDQKVPIFRLGTKARAQLSILNKPKPDISKLNSSRAREELVKLNSVYFDSFGVSLSRLPVEAKGSILHKPILQYRSQIIEPPKDYWESGVFYQAKQLIENWCVVNTTHIDEYQEDIFFQQFSQFSVKFGFNLGKPHYLSKSKQDMLDNTNSMQNVIEECKRMTNGKLRFIMFVIDSSSTQLNRLIHLSFDDLPELTAACLRVDSIMNQKQRRSIFRTLAHKLNARLGGTNLIYHNRSLESLSLVLEDLMIIGLDVTHPDNELSGVSIVGCAYTYSSDLFKHRSLVWPQTARVEIIGKMDNLMKKLIHEYFIENNRRIPKQIIVYRDGVSHEEFERVKTIEISKAQSILDSVAKETCQSRPNLSYIIAQKRHTMRFYQVISNGNSVTNPPSGTLIDQDVVTKPGREFFLYSNTSPQATARPLHYHVLLNGLGIENLQKLTYFLCFNFGKCSGTLSMPSSLRYAHNAAYDARNRVIAAREFSQNSFYPNKFFC